METRKRKRNNATLPSKKNSHDDSEDQTNSKKKNPVCETCQMTFSRTDGLLKHKRRKHTDILKQQESTPTKIITNMLTGTEASEVIGFRKSSTQKRKKSTQGGNNSMATTQKKANETKKEVSFLKTACKTLENIGIHSLVILVDGEEFQLFGSKCGQLFGRQHKQYFQEFMQFCQEKGLQQRDDKNDLGLENEKRDTKRIKMSQDSKSIKSKVNKTSVFELLVNNKDSEEHKETLDDEAMEVFTEKEDQIKMSQSNKASTETKSFITSEDTDTQNVSENEDEDENHSEYLEDVNIVKSESESKKDHKKKCLSRRCQRKCPRQEEKHDLKEEMLQGWIKDLEKEENGNSAMVKEILKRRYVPESAAIYSVRDLDKGRFECLRCKYKFIWKCHLDIHHSKYPFCSPNETFDINVDDAFKEEVSFVHADTEVEITATLQSLFEAQQVRPYTCIICQKTVHSPAFLKEHLLTHKKTTVFKCNICGQNFTTQALLSNHLKKHFLFPFECLTCTWRFSQASHLEKHAKTGCGNISLLDNSTTQDTHMTSEYKCSACKEEVSGLQGFLEHLQIRHPSGDGGFECKHCGYVSTRTHLYEEHMRQHLGKHPCPFCERLFTNKSRLKDHVRAHRSKMQDNVCYVCGVSFNMKRKLDIHIRIHTGENPFKCKEEGCTKSFRSLDGLQQHKWVHSNQKFICDVCGRSFKNPAVLNYHRRSHTTEGRWKCFYCPETCHTLFCFKRHLVQKHPEKKEEIEQTRNIKLHQCQICQKLYHDSEDYKQHMNTHIGIKPFKCKYCGKCFANSSNLRCHEDNHEGVPKQKCTLCSRKFKTQEGLNKHIENKHSVINSDNPVTVQQLPSTLALQEDSNAVSFQQACDTVALMQTSDSFILQETSDDNTLVPLIVPGNP